MEVCSVYDSMAYKPSVLRLCRRESSLLLPTDQNGAFYNFITLCIQRFIQLLVFGFKCSPFLLKTLPLIHRVDPGSLRTSTHCPTIGDKLSKTLKCWAAQLCTLFLRVLTRSTQFFSFGVLRSAMLKLPLSLLIEVCLSQSLPAF